MEPRAQSLFFQIMDAINDGEARWDQVKPEWRAAILRNDPRRDWWLHQRPDQTANLNMNIIVRVCGRGVGKSLFGSHLTNHLLGPYGYSRGIVLAPTDGMSRDTNILGDDGVVACSRTLLPENFKTERGGRHTLHYPNGSRLYVGSAASPRSVRGRSTQFLDFDELTHYDDLEEVFTAVLPSRRPRIGEMKGMMIITSTPNMLYPKANQYLMELKERSGIDVDFQQVPSEVNRAISADTHRQNREDFIGGELLEQQEYDAVIHIDAGNTILFKQWMFERYEMQQGDSILFTFGFIDPAITSNAASDKTGITIASRTKRGDVLFHHTEEARYTPSELYERMIELDNFFHPDIWRGESNVIGDFFAEGVPLPNFDIIRAEKDKRTRAMGILGLFEKKKVVLLGGQANHVDFITQATGFAGVDKLNLCDNDDVTDCAVHNVRLLWEVDIVELFDPQLATA